MHGVEFTIFFFIVDEGSAIYIWMQAYILAHERQMPWFEFMGEELKMSTRKFFEGQRCVIATMHGKEQIIQPILENRFGLICELPGGLDTDQFGTFSGEIERRGSQVEAALLKIKQAFEQSDAAFAIASEGSFGPHPQLGFVPADIETIVCSSRSGELQIIATEMSTATNFGSANVTSSVQLLDFAKISGFPEHGLILKLTGLNGEIIGLKKGIQDQAGLLEEYERLWRQAGTLVVETDMRAHMNPSRRKVIASVAEKLALKMASGCPACNFPGYEVVTYQPGLPCDTCGQATRRTFIQNIIANAAAIQKRRCTLKEYTTSRLCIVITVILKYYQGR